MNADCQTVIKAASFELWVFVLDAVARAGIAVGSILEDFRGCRMPDGPFRVLSAVRRRPRCKGGLSQSKALGRLDRAAEAMFARAFGDVPRLGTVQPVAPRLQEAVGVAALWQAPGRGDAA